MVAKYITVFLLSFTLASSAQASPKTQVDTAAGSPSYTDASMELAQLGLYRYVFELWNVDDEAKLYLNNEETPLLSKSYFEEGSISILPGGRLYDGKNTVKLVVTNTGGGWTYGLRVYKKGAVLPGEQLLIDDSCGEVGVLGCEGNDQSTGEVVNKTYSFNRY